MIEGELFERGSYSRGSLSWKYGNRANCCDYGWLDLALPIFIITAQVNFVKFVEHQKQKLHSERKRERNAVNVTIRGTLKQNG